MRIEARIGRRGCDPNYEEIVSVNWLKLVYEGYVKSKSEGEEALKTYFLYTFVNHPLAQELV